MRPSFHFPSAQFEHYNPWDDAGPPYDFEIEDAGDNSDLELCEGYRRSMQNDSRDSTDGYYSYWSCNSGRGYRRGSDEWSENNSGSGSNHGYWENGRCGPHGQLSYHGGNHCEEESDSNGFHQRSLERLTREEWRRLEWNKKEGSPRSSSPRFSWGNLPIWKGKENAHECSTDSASGSQLYSSSYNYSSFTTPSQQSGYDQDSRYSIIAENSEVLLRSENQRKEDQLLSLNESQVKEYSNIEEIDKSSNALQQMSLQEHSERSKELSGVEKEKRRVLRSGDGSQPLKQVSTSDLASARFAERSFSKLGAGDRDGAVVLAPKKNPAIKEGKRMVPLLTNFWELEVHSKIVYRYDVAMYLGIPENQKAIDLLRGSRDDSAIVARRELCSDAIYYALRSYHILSEGSAVVHDGGGILFSSEDLAAALKKHNGLLTFAVTELTYELYRFVREDVRKKINRVTVEILPCREAASSFDLADLSAQSNRNWATINRSWKQFYELVTNQDAVLSGRFTRFGAGSLFYCRPTAEWVGYGYERFAGARKGIKFIEGRRSGADDIVAALVLDHRLGVFFKQQSVMASVRELDGLKNVVMFDFSVNENGRLNTKWNEVNQYLKGMRMNYDGYGSSFSFVASGISEEPIKTLKEILPNDAKTEISVLSKYAKTDVRINPNWPAVVYRNQERCHYFPMELLEIATHQRVPLGKQLLANSASRADRPEVRLEKIHSLLEALNLHDSGSKNEFLRAFGISIASKPKEVLGFRRQPPGVCFADRKEYTVDDSKCNWRSNSDAKFVDGAEADRIIIVHSDKTARLPRIVRDILITMFELRGIRCRRFEAVFLSCRSIYEMEVQLEQIFKENKNSDESLLVIFIDRSENKSHENILSSAKSLILYSLLPVADFLKLMERKYLIPTQQITTEVVEKLPRQHQSSLFFVSKMNLKLGGFNYAVVPESFAHNHWIANGETLVVGYDVTHPGKPSRDEIMNMMPPQRPSVVGFSFNGTVHPECFIGDYHFQTPRQERVESSILNARFKWILSLYSRYRKQWPSRVLITRDGVSEGQYRMVISEELSAIKEACEEFGRLNGNETWMPRFTVVIATKRHNARFFVQNGCAIENPKPATVVDTDVVRNDITEFYMQSHRPIQGTAKPTSYQIIVDENDLSADELQSLMFALTFQHQISDAPLSIPEPIYQADEWAKRGKDIWKAYTDRHNPIRMKDRGAYADLPIDFEAMTRRLAFWNTKLENRRVNA